MFVIAMIFALLNIIKELLPFSYNYKLYFQNNSLYNYLDAILYVGIFILLICDMSSENEIIQQFHFFWFMFLCLRTILEFRIFGPFRHLASMMIRTYIDIIPFTVFLVCYMIVYALLQFLNFLIYEKSYEGQSFGLWMMTGIDIAFGNWNIDPDWPFFRWFLFLFTIFTVSIMMLNVIIAIVSATYDEY